LFCNFLDTIGVSLEEADVKASGVEEDVEAIEVDADAIKKVVIVSYRGRQVDKSKRYSLSLYMILILTLYSLLPF
jgi:hypothetical protein